MQLIKIIPVCLFFLIAPLLEGLSQQLEDTVEQSHLINDTIIEQPEKPQTYSDKETSDDSKKAVPWFTENQILSPFSTPKQTIDTTLIGFQIYDYAFRDDFFIAQKGNIGHVGRSLVFNPVSGNEFSPIMQNYHHGYVMSHSDLLYIRPKHVFSELKYVVGSEREQLFHAKHAQKIDEDLYMGFAYRVISSPGQYSRLATRNNNLYGIVDYKGFNDKYQVVVTATNNKLMNNESGGLKNRLGFEQDPVRDSVFLYKAEYAYHDLELNLNHYFRFGFDIKSEEQEIIIEDSIITKTKTKHFNFGRIGHELKYKRQAFVFEDNNPVYPYFESVPFDQQLTYDSTVVRILQNELSWTNYPLNPDKLLFPLNFKFFVQHQYLNFKFPLLLYKNADDEEDKYEFDERIYNQYVGGAELSSDNSRYLSVFGNADYTIDGYNNNDYSINGGINLGRYKDIHRTRLSVGFSERMPAYFLNYYLGNYHGWANKFQKMKVANASAIYSYKGFQLSGNYFILNNMVYMNENVVPEQNTSTFNAATFVLDTDHTFWNFGLRNKIVYQLIPSSQFENYPDIITYHSLYYGNKVFKNALQFQIGLDVYYNSPYHPSAYMPVVMQFYKQTDYKSDLLLIDAFINFKISDVRLFLKFQNFGNLIFDKSVNYQIPFYPLPESMIKFGASWMFFN